jgi:hypothetical protein
MSPPSTYKEGGLVAPEPRSLRSASRNMPTSTARRARSSSQSIRSSGKARLSGYEPTCHGTSRH